MSETMSTTNCIEDETIMSEHSIHFCTSESISITQKLFFFLIKFLMEMLGCQTLWRLHTHVKAVDRKQITFVSIQFLLCLQPELLQIDENGID